MLKSCFFKNWILNSSFFGFLALRTNLYVSKIFFQFLYSKVVPIDVVLISCGAESTLSLLLLPFFQTDENIVCSFFSDSVAVAQGTVWILCSFMIISVALKSKIVFLRFSLVLSALISLKKVKFIFHFNDKTLKGKYHPKSIRGAIKEIF